MLLERQGSRPAWQAATCPLNRSLQNKDFFNHINTQEEGKRVFSATHPPTQARRHWLHCQ